MPLRPNDLLDAGPIGPGPANALAPQPTWADAAQFNAPVVADAWRTAQTPEFWKDAAGQWANSLLMGSTAPGFRAFHGSPHSFPPTPRNPHGEFDPSKIGTGEGAQAYGVGAAYLADSESLARGYRDALSGPTFNGVPYAQVDAPWRARDAMRWITEGGEVKTLAQAADRMQATADDFSKQAGAIKGSRFQAENDRLAFLAKEHADAADWLRKNVGGDLQRGGHMYEVQVNADPAHFLDWDKPLAEQGPLVQDKIRNLQSRKMLPQGWTAEDMATLKGQHLLQELRHTAGSEVKASALLAEAVPGTGQGIPGIRYLDAGSRGAGEGTSNHVIFDAATMEILRKYGIAGLIGGGGAAAGASQQ